MRRVVLITAHPSPTSFNAGLAAAYRAGAEHAGAQVTHVDATALVFDPVLRVGLDAPQLPDEPDLARVRAAVEAAHHVAWIFPTWWVGLPAALKALVDRLLIPGWAYRHEGRPLPTGLMRGRSTRYVATMDSPALWYWLAHHDALGGAFGRGTLSYVGFGPIRRDLVFSVRTLSARQRQRWIERMRAVGARDVEGLRPQKSFSTTFSSSFSSMRRNSAGPTQE